MNAASDLTVTRDFSDLAILRGTAAAIAAAYVMSVLTLALLAAAWSPAGLDAGRLLLSIPDRLIAAFQPLPIFMSAVVLSCVAMVGLFALAAHKDHTTYRAAFHAGVITAGIVIALPLIMILISMIAQGAFEDLPDLVIFVAPSLATGGVSGLVGRFAAGAPRALLSNNVEIVS